MFKIKRTLPMPGVILLKFQNQYEVCSTFMRLQEFYESPFKEIRGKFFSLETFMDRYAKQQGNFTYTLDWGGFNVPGHVVDQFYELYCNDLLDKEKRLFEFVMPSSSDPYCAIAPYYVIAMYDEASLEHELAHALYYLNPEYQKTVKALVKTLPKSVYTAIEKWLVQSGYSKPQVVDEINAYLTTSGEHEMTDRFGKVVGKRYAKYEPFRKAYEQASGRKLPVFVDSISLEQ